MHDSHLRTLRLGISTCPNDTFLFHGLLTGAIEIPGIALEIELLDVQELNERLLAGDFDAAKASYHLALRMADELIALPTGSALGFGNGPLVLARAGLDGQRPGPSSHTLCPGEHTTATLLFRLFHPDAAAPEQVVFSAVMPALERGTADFGVCIHEGRFTYADSGLGLIEDLGATWETATQTPLPLGGIFARRGLDEATLDALQDGLRRSLAFAHANRDAAGETMRRHAQELSEAVMWDHVKLYVNHLTRDLGHEGRRAIATLAERGARVGVIPKGQHLAVFEPLHERSLFHLVPSADGAPGASGLLDAPSLSAEGFVHLSFRGQLQGTLDTHFGGVDRVTILELDRDLAAAALRFESSRGGALFPHLYRAIDLGADVVARTVLEREDGRFDLATSTISATGTTDAAEP